MAELWQGHRWRARLALTALLTTALACEQTPSKGDYHSREADLIISEIAASDPSDINTFPTTDLEVTPDTEIAIEPADLLATELPDAPTPVPNVRSCSRTFTFTPPDGSPPCLAGEFTNWADAELPMVDDGAGNWTISVDLSELSPGNYSYKFHTAADGWFLDPSNPLGRWTAGIENSKLIVPDCTLPELQLEEWTLNADATGISASVLVFDGPESEGIIPSSATVLLNGVKLADPGYDPSTGRFAVTLTGLVPGTKATLRFAIANQVGSAQEVILPIWLEKDPWQWQDAAIYFAFTDRFANGDTTNDAPSKCTSAESLTNWQGGDFAGITARLEDGYFDQLGIDVLWLSPVIDNPDGCMGGTLEGITYTAYHGYFPIDLLATENHFGDLQELRTLVDAAHARGIRVLIDFVANHLHDENPLFQAHEQDGWFHEFNSCEPAWDKPIECWFMPYLPDLDYTNDAVVELALESALFWIVESGIDGFRVDAVKHMVHNFIRSLRFHIEERIAGDSLPFYMVGETFMGEWGGGIGMAETVIKEYVNPWELDGQFDFPFYWKLVKATARDEGDFVEFASFLEAALPFWGEGAVMVSFLGNHDVPRFLSHAAGHIGDLWGNGSKLQGLNDPPPLPEQSEPFARLRLAQGLLFTLPEVPLIYYGDEVGLPGAGDPDNRRVMPFDNLSDNQQQTLDFVRLVGTIRRTNAPFRRGDFTLLSATPNTLVFRRKLGNEELLVAANRSASEEQVEIPKPSSGTTLIDLLTQTEVTVQGDFVQLTIPPFGLAIYQ
jgi:neopullulanase